MIQNKEDYVLIDENVAKLIPKGTPIYVADIKNSIEYMLEEDIPNRFTKYVKSSNCAVRTEGFSWCYGCVLKSNLTGSILTTTEEENYLIF